MQAEFAAQLIQALSGERLGAYRDRTGGDGLQLFSHYTWNMALSESLYPALQVLEVALRNSIHNAARAHFGCDDWFNDRALVNSSHEIAALNKAHRTLQRQRRPLDSGRVIAELSFGFWTSLLDRRYEQVLWPRLLKAAFPEMPRRLRTRQNLSRRFQRIRHLRNRIFHHEPIWHWKDLARQHRDTLEAVAWIEPAAQALVTAVDRFPDVYQTGLAEIEQRLRRFC